MMTAHWKYLLYILRHKWFVFVWCCRYGIPLAGIVHDLSKFHPSEWFPYVRYFYGGPWPEANPPGIKYAIGDMYTQPWVDEQFDVAWNLHQKRNPHHWQFWVLHKDSGEVVPLDMPLRYCLEMLADWRGAGMAINGKDDTASWYLKNRETMLLHPRVRHWIETHLGFRQNIFGELVSLDEVEEVEID